jgi:hypothetical protein
MMKSTSYHFLIYVLLSAGLALAFAACSSSTDPYKPFVGKREIKYPQKADTIIVRGGLERAVFEIPRPIDPHVTKVKIFWNNGTDSVKAKFTKGQDTLKVVADSLETAGSYTFNIYTYDQSGDKSVGQSETVKVYGSTYANSLLNRGINSTDGVKTNTSNRITIYWSKASSGSIGTVVKYTNISNKADSVFVSVDSSETLITNISKKDSRLHYSTLYLPTASIDTFYTNTDFLNVKFYIVAKNHNYTGVFADDPLNPHYLYFVGYPRNQKQEMVWKYDLKEDSLVAGYPKKVTDVFNLPYPQKISQIGTVAWLEFTSFTPIRQAYFFGNGYYYTYNIETQQTVALHPITDLSTEKWPPSNWPKRLECAFYRPSLNANYLFNGDIYEKMYTGPKRAWAYPNTGHKGVGGPKKPWPGIPVSFSKRGFNGCYLDKAAGTAHFYSGNEFVIFNVKPPGVQGGIKKIQKVYKGL